MKQNSFHGLPALAIASGATAPNPGYPGVLAWSTTLSVIVSWSGTSWNALVNGPVAATTVTNTPAGSITDTNVQTAIDVLAARSIRGVVVTTASVVMGTAIKDYVYFVAGAHLISLPSPNNNQYTVKNNHTAKITIDTAGVELIEGANSISISPGSAVSLVSDGTNWYVI